ncbi:MAG TPA: hypothetical protein VFN30_01355 [Chitinophagaceae bacterium]|nr:hypothetical protein [Chitinophagaceae bacterium]
MNELENISRKKEKYAVSKSLRKYLRRYGRDIQLPLSYSSLKYYQSAVPLYDKDGKDSLWETVFFSASETNEIHKSLKRIYSLLKASGHTQAEEHLSIERIDYCTFGNSNPFRIKIVNNYNDVHDYFYIKIADASRIYGLELETLLSPNWINYLVDETTLVEEHIAGIPGDVFAKEHINRPEYNPKRIAKEFIKFNERCFVRLLGDMRSYNFVFDITQDFDDIQFRIRAIDFDQQSYEGRKNIYRPQFFKENKVFVDLVSQLIHPDVIKQYQLEERTQIVRRMKSHRHRIRDLRDAATNDELSTPEKIQQLKQDLAEYYNNPDFLDCKTVGNIMDMHLKELVKGDIKQS